jgi:peptidoglycan/LPS O-acetylase OafA/YrhL
VSTSPRRGDIEGLRAVAVLTVLGFHAAVPFFSGGYVGVDVFFIISGFLITGLLVKDVAKTGRFSLREFYARRARRILPSAGVVLLAVALGSWLLLPPLRVKDVAYDLLASALNVGNWRFVAEQTDYLAAQRDPSPLLHFWSLGVEEQFYLLWAPLVLLIAVLAKRFGRSPLPIIAIALGGITAGSLALSLDWTSTSTPLAYLGSPSRAWEFGAGALAAVAAPAFGRSTALRWCAGWAGLAAIVWSTVVLDSATAFPGTAALVPVLGTAAVLLAGAGPARFGVGSLLGLASVRAIGRLSYTWYLWHWPVLVFAEATFGSLAWPVKAALVAASAGPAWLTTRLVERPLRFSAIVSALPRRGLAIGAVAIMVPLAAGLLLGSGAQRAMDTGVDTAASTVPLGAAEGPNLLAGAVDRTGRQVLPPTGRARVDTPPVPGCEVAPADVAGPPCVFGDVTSPGRVLLVGDSHASQWYSAVAYLARRRHWAVQVLVKQGCPLPELTVANPTLGRTYTECDTWRRHTLDQIAHGPKPRLILVSSLNHYTDDEPKLKTAWDRTLDRLAVTGAPIAYLRDNPMPGKDVPACVSGALMDWDACAFPRAQALQPDPLADEILGHQRPGMSLVDVNDVLCPQARCPAVIQGILLYRDDSHLTDTAVGVLRRRVEKTLQDQGAIPAVTS